MTTYVYETIPQHEGEQPEYCEIKQSIRDAPFTKHPQSDKPIRRVILGGYGVLKSGGSEPTAGGGACGCGPGGCCD